MAQKLNGGGSINLSVHPNPMPEPRKWPKEPKPNPVSVIKMPSDDIPFVVLVLFWLLPCLGFAQGSLTPGKAPERLVYEGGTIEFDKEHGTGIRGIGYIDTTLVSKFFETDRVDFQARTYDLRLEEITIFYRQRKDSVFVGWDEFLYYQDAVTPRSIKEAVGVYEIVLNQLLPVPDEK